MGGWEAILVFASNVFLSMRKLVLVDGIMVLPWCSEVTLFVIPLALIINLAKLLLNILYCLLPFLSAKLTKSIV